METLLDTRDWLDSAGKRPPIWSSHRAGESAARPTKGIEMTGYDALRSGEATYYGEALIAAQWLSDATFTRYATAQGVDVWERLALCG